MLLFKGEAENLVVMGEFQMLAMMMNAVSHTCDKIIQNCTQQMNADRKGNPDNTDGSCQCQLLGCDIVNLKKLEKEYTR